MMRNNGICSKNSAEVEGAFLCSALCSMAQQKESPSPTVRQQHCHRDCPCVCAHFHSASPTWHTECFWHSHGHLSISSLLWLPHTALVFGAFGFSVVCPRILAFCVFVTRFCSSSGLQCVVGAWRCSACHSGLSTAQICYVVTCDGSDKILCLCFLVSASVLILELWNLF